MQMLSSRVLLVLTGLLVLSVTASVEHDVEARHISDVTSCKSDLDLIFLVDGSDAVPDRGWGQLRGWLSSLMNVFSISPWQTRIGLIQLGDQARFDIKLSGNATAVSEAAESMTLLKSGKSDFRGGLQLASNELLTNFRPGIPRVIVILSNSDQNSDSGAVSFANTLRSQLTDVVVVAIGSEVNSAFLGSLATDSRNTYLTASGFSRLDAIQQSLIVKLCVRLERLEPSSGPTSGGTAVRVFGSGFTPSPSLACYFGTQYSQATFVDTRSIVCRSVAQLYFGQQNISLSVTPNSIDFTSRNLTFTYEIECPNGCSGRGVCIHGSCLCDQGWTGIDCSGNSMNTTSPNTTCPNSCNNNGWCNNGTCQCNWPWTGYDCSVNPMNGCPNNCNNNGWCNNGTCQCNPGWTGYDCSIVNNGTSCHNNCSSNGYCSFGQCICNWGWSGSDCSYTPCNPPCANGYCNPSNSTCSCNFGWQGHLCQDPVPCPRNCSSHGTCNSGYCSCDNGWFGDDCSVRGLPCPHNCSGNGWCNSNGTCSCYGMFTGRDCSQTVECPRNCSNNGWCMNSGECYCNAGWTGPACTIPVQTCPNNCSGHGYCASNHMCMCYSGFVGADCSRHQHECPNNCSTHGRCDYSTGHCACSIGWTGVDCSSHHMKRDLGSDAQTSIHNEEEKDE